MSKHDLENMIFNLEERKDLKKVEFTQKAVIEVLGYLKELQDLEAKLVEKEKLIEDSIDVHEMEEKDIYKLRYELAGATETIEVLKQQLAEKEKAYTDLKELEQATKESLYASREYLDKLKSEKWALEKQLAEKNELIKTQYDGIDYWKSLANKRPDIDFAIKNRELEQQLAEKDKEIESLRENSLSKRIFKEKLIPSHCMEQYEKYEQQIDKFNLDKIDFAIAELEKARDDIHMLHTLGFFKIEEIDKKLDNQIKALKEGK